MVRGGKTGLREHRRSLHPFVVRERELKARSNLQPSEAEEFHSLHRLFTDASALGSRIWDFTTSRTLAEHLHVSGRIIDSVCGTSASPRSPDHSPGQEEEEFPSWTQPVTPEPSVHSVGSSPDRSMSPVRTVLNPSEAVRTATIAPDVRDLRVAVLLDHHGVLDKSFRTSTELIRRLRGEFGSEVYIHPASRGVAAHTAGLFRSVRGAKGGVEYEEQSSTGELTYITAGFVNFHFSPVKLPKLRIFTFPPRGGSPS